MLKSAIFFTVLFCSLQQNYAFVIPFDAGNAGFGAESSVSDHQLDRKSPQQPQSFFPDFPFAPPTDPNDALFPANLPQFGMQFATNGMQMGLSSGFDIPYQSGNIIDPGGMMRDLGQQDMFNQPLPPNGVVTGTMQSMSQSDNQPPVFKTETFNMGPNGQQVYENNKLVENIPNQQQPVTPQDPNQKTSNVSQNPQTLTPQLPTGTVPQTVTGNLQQPINPSTMPLSQTGIPNYPGSPMQPSYPSNSQMQPPNLSTSNPNYSGSTIQPPNLSTSNPKYSGPTIQPPNLSTSNPNYSGSTIQPPNLPNPNPNYSGSTIQPPNLPNPNPNYSGLPVQPSNLPTQNQQLPTYPGSQGQQPGYPTQSTPFVKMSSAGASSSTFVSSTNDQPPQMAQNAGAYNYNYDSTRPNPVNGNYLAVNGYTPNVYDPSQGNYQYTQGQFPTQQNAGGYIPNPLNPSQNPGGYNSPMFGPGNPKFKQDLQQKPLRPSQSLPFMNQNPLQQNFLPHFPIPNEIQNHIGRLNNHLSSLGVGMPQLDPSAMAAPLAQFMQTIPSLVRNAANQGLQISKMPFDMLNAALDAFNTDLSNVRVNEFVQIPTEGGRAIVNTIEEIINQFQRNLHSNMPQNFQSNMPQNFQSNLPQNYDSNMPQNAQLYQQPTLARRSADPDPQWMMPDMNQMSQYYNSIPFGTAQEKINTMKNDILSKMPTMSTPSFSQFNQPFNYFSKPQIPQMPQMPQFPKFPQASSNGEPVVKVYSSSVSESTQSSSKNGGPPEVSHQAAGYKYDYDSTKKDKPVESDLVAMKGYTPDASDPSKGTYVAYENSYP